VLHLNIESASKKLDVIFIYIKQLRMLQTYF